MTDSLHLEIVKTIRKQAGKPSKDAFLNSYLGNDHLIYQIKTPPLRKIARSWIREHRDLSPSQFADVLSGLIQGPSFTEKVTAGMLLGYSAPEQRSFNPEIFDSWLEHLVGWAEVDAVCTNNYSVTQIPGDWRRWKKLLNRFSKDENISKRRASLVFLCAPLRQVYDEEIAAQAFKLIDRLSHEKHVMITKAISWLLRSMTTPYRREVERYLETNAASLPKIAVRETRTKLDLGTKSKRGKSNA